MTGVCRVERVQSPTEAERKYPLATKGGVNALMQIVAADSYWSPLTALQKRALSDAYHAALDGLSEGDEVPLPALPGGVNPRTVRSLEGRGLAAGGALTATAVEVVRWAEPFEESKRQQREKAAEWRRARAETGGAS